MKASSIVLVFASLLLASLFSQAAYADCPCVGTANMGCAEESNPPTGPNDCTDNPTGLVLPATDGQGCIEVTTDSTPGANCEACVGGAVRSLNNDMPPELVLAKGCVCVINADMMSWTCVSTNGVNANDPDVPGGIPTQDELDALILVEDDVTGDGTSMCEMRAEMACTAPTPM